MGKSNCRHRTLLIVAEQGESRTPIGVTNPNRTSDSAEAIPARPPSIALHFQDCH